MNNSKLPFIKIKIYKEPPCIKSGLKNPQLSRQRSGGSKGGMKPLQSPTA